jgi:F-type H+-transporting ATPase subunit delta
VLKGAVARRYAQAVFEIGVEQKTVDRWLEDLGVIAEYFGYRRLAFVLSEPNIPFERKKLIVQDLLGSKIQHDALGLALLLVERDIADAAPRIREEYERRYNEYHNQAVADVTTALPLDADLRASIQADLAHITGKRIILRERVDPSILGGAIARVGDTLLDGSVRRKLMLLRQEMERGGGFFGPSDGETIPPDLGGPNGGTPAAPAPGGSQGSGPSADGKGSPTGPGGGPRSPSPTSLNEQGARGHQDTSRRDQMGSSGLQGRGDRRSKQRGKGRRH